MNIIIERDILLTALIMVIGLLYSNGSGLHGLPFPWFSAGNEGSSPEAFLGSLAVSVIIVAVCEVLNAVRRAAEPVALRNPSYSQTSYANIFDDDDVQTRPPSGYSERPARSAKKFPAQNHRSGNTRRVRSSTDPAKLVLRVVILIFVATFIFIFGVFAIIMNESGLHDDHSGSDNSSLFDDSEEYDYEDTDIDDSVSFYDSSFFTEEGYLDDDCNAVFDMLEEGDTEGLSEIGEGDPDALIDMLDWTDVEYDEEYRFMAEGDPDSGFIRYKVESEGEKYMLSIKFAGDGMADDEDAAEITGVAACPYKPWDDYGESDLDDKAWTKLKEDVDKSSVSIGDDMFMDYSILYW